MTIESLKYVNQLFTEAGIPYQFMEWQGKLTYPYFVGEYSEPEPTDEDGLQESTFMVTGTTDGSWLELEEVKERIKQLCDTTDILPNGNGIAILYSGSLNVPTGNERMKRIQVNLVIKEWSVN